MRLTQSVTGIDETGLATAYVEWPSDYRTQPERMYAIVGAAVDAASAETRQPIGQVGGIPGLHLPGALWLRGADPKTKPVAVAFPADPAAMTAFRLGLVSGRMPTVEEFKENAPVAVVDERAASLIAPGGNALGALCEDGQIRDERTERRVIGIVGRIDLTFGRAAAEGTAFVPFERRFGEPRLLAVVTAVLGILALVLTVAGRFQSPTTASVAARLKSVCAWRSAPRRHAFAGWCFGKRSCRPSPSCQRPHRHRCCCPRGDPACVTRKPYQSNRRPASRLARFPFACSTPHVGRDFTPGCSAGTKVPAYDYA